MSEQSDSNGLEVSFGERPDGAMVVRFRGRLDAAGVRAAWSQSRERITAGSPRRLVVDASGLSQCDGAGLGLFAELRRLMERLNGQGLGLDVLSMGMSGDFEAAIAEGATHVRVGTAIFGPRA